MLVDRYFELVEQEWSAVSSSWKELKPPKDLAVLQENVKTLFFNLPNGILPKIKNYHPSYIRIIHVIFLISAVISGACYTYVFGTIQILFGGKCFLFPSFYPIENQPPKVTVSNISRSESAKNYSKLINSSQISYNYLFYCNFIEFFPLFCSIFACILIAMLLLYGKGGNSIKNGLRAPWRLIAPATIITFIFSLILVINTKYFFVGISRFCANFTATYGNKSNDLIFTTVTKLYDSGKTLIDMDINELLELQVFVASILLCSWVVTFIVFFIRVVTITDFQLICISVYSEREKFSGQNMKALDLKKGRKTPYMSIEKEMSRLSLFTGTSPTRVEGKKSQSSKKGKRPQKSNTEINVNSSATKIHYFYVPESSLKHRKIIQETDEIKYDVDNWSPTTISPNMSELYFETFVPPPSDTALIERTETVENESEEELVVVNPDEDKQDSEGDKRKHKL